MRVFVTGASGHIASAVVPELLSAGHTVTGLARSDRAADVVRTLGAEVRRGDLDDLDGLAAASREADGVVHLAFDHGLQHSGDLPAAAAADLRAIEAMGTALAGSGKPFVGTGATLALFLAGHQGLLTEDDTRPHGPRVDAENAAVALADQGVRSCVVRLPNVHGPGSLGFLTGLVALARATGVAGYVGDGSRWPSADTRDVGRLYRLALESAPAGSRWHAVAEEGVALRDAAEVIGRRLGVPARPIAPDAAERHFGSLSMFVGLDGPASSRRTRETLGWEPVRPGLLADLDDARQFLDDAGHPATSRSLTRPPTWRTDVVIRLDHTIVVARDNRRGAEFLAAILGLEVGPPTGPFVPVTLADGVTLDFLTVRGHTERLAHYAFLIGEDEFDECFGRIEAAGVEYYADPHLRLRGQVNRHDGGRGVYFQDPTGNTMELVTRPYGGWPA